MLPLQFSGHPYILCTGTNNIHIEKFNKHVPYKVESSLTLSHTMAGLAQVTSFNSWEGSPFAVASIFKMCHSRTIQIFRVKCNINTLM